MSSTSVRAIALLVSCVFSHASCRRGAPSGATEPASEAPPQTSAASAAPTAWTRPSAPPVPPLPATRQPAAPRVVALGDVHGDITAMRAALRLAGAIDEQNHWSGGSLVVVQTGDLLDRGDDERAILEWVPVLADEARRAGGAFHALNGNHELMNALGDFRYVTRGGFADFRGHEGLLRGHPALERLPEHARSRAAAFAPGGTWARLLAGLNTVLVVGDTAFVHGGLLPEHVRFGLDEINRTVRAFLMGDRDGLPSVLEHEDSPVWYRGFALRDDAETCALLGRALEAAHVRRLVVGHTVQERGVTSACDGRVWRIDVGLARYYRGPTQALEIAGEGVRVLGASVADARDGHGPHVEGARRGSGSSVGEEALSNAHMHPQAERASPARGHDCAGERPSTATGGLLEGRVVLPSTG